MIQTTSEDWEEYETRKYHYEVKFLLENQSYYITESEFDKLKCVVSFTRKTSEELYQALRDNADTEEIKRRNQVSGVIEKEGRKRQAEYKLLKSSY